MVQKLKNYELSFSDCLDALKSFHLLESDCSYHQSEASSSSSELLRSIETDSRQTSKDSIFIAYKGISTDGHNYIGQACNKGARLIIFESDNFQNSLPSEDKDISWIRVNDGRGAWSVLCSALYKHPEKKLRFYGITGTNGKTTVSWMLNELLKLHDIKTLMIGTLGIYFDGKFTESKHTTPDPNVLYKLFSEAAETGIDTVIMEVSSHAISQSKLLPIKFEGAGFTSFSRDHLDFHKSYKEYFDAKKSLFETYLSENCLSVICSSVISQGDIIPSSGSKIIYGLESGKNRPERDISISVAEKEETFGSQFRLDSSDESSILKTLMPLKIAIPYFGSYNLENFTAALLLASQRTLIKSQVVEAFKSLSQVPGRMKVIANSSFKNCPYVIVDYAHTPDALEEVLKSVRPCIKGKILTIFGCGGDRDTGKRPLMAKIAESYSNIVVVTNDNPRFEDPAEIIRQIKSGFSNPSQVIFQPDRENAIKWAIETSGSADLVLIAGKGHENYQITKGETIEFDDSVVAEKFMVIKE